MLCEFDSASHSKIEAKRSEQAHKFQSHQNSHNVSGFSKPARGIIGFLLMVSVSLYSTPLEADSYDSDQEIFAQDSSVNADASCEVTPGAAEEAPASVDQTTLAEQNPIQEQNADETAPLDNGNYTDQETLVTPENTEQNKRGRYKYWQNILLAVAVVAVAITALLIVDSHEGHKSHHH